MRIVGVKNYLFLVISVVFISMDPLCFAQQTSQVEAEAKITGFENDLINALVEKNRRARERKKLRKQEQVQGGGS